ncbi:MAG: tetratricopeptide repeat protein [Flavobacteriales bacterium]|nr:tetratricopeptide repeat protein [Flavobacteriales bacterium]
MTRYFFLFTLFTFASLSALSQQTGTKGAKVVGKETSSQNKKGNTYALIVGISKYQYPDTYVPLQFADKDARIFYAYLTSEAGGKIKNEFIDTLFNERATYGEIMRSLLSIKERMQEGDLLYFYFSGHGDAYNASLTFLLPYDAPAGIGKSDKNHYLTGSTVLNLYTIKNIFLELTSTGKRVIFISDACRTNELSGGEPGRTSVFKRIMEEDAGEIRFTSCSSNQVSLEGPQWGNGRGLFSWHLVNGLIGMADVSPPDGEVTVDELKTYVEQNVKNATYDKNAKVYRQTPQFACSIENCETIVLNVVNQREKERLALELEKGGNQFFQEALAMHTPGKGVDLPAEMQKIGKKHLYDLFIEHINKQQLIGETSAASVYDIIARDKEIPQKLVNEFKGILSSYLITDVNKIINDYLNAARDNDDYTYEYFYTGYKKLKKFQEIADPLFYNEIDIKVNLLFLEGHAGFKAYKYNDIYNSLAKIDSAIQLKPEAAYLYNIKGYLLYNLNRYSQALKSFKKAIELAPNWIYPTINLGWVYFNMEAYDSAYYYFHKALKINPNDEISYNALADYFNLTNQDSVSFYINKILELDKDDNNVLYNRGLYYKNYKHDLDSAFIFFRKFFLKDTLVNSAFHECMDYFFEKINTNYSYFDSILFYKTLVETKDTLNPYLYYYLGLKSQNYNLDTAAYNYFTTAISIDTLNPIFWNALGDIYYNRKDIEKAIIIYLHSLNLDTNFATTYYYLGLSYYSYFKLTSNYNAYYSAIYYFLKYIEQNPFKPIPYFNIGYIYFLLKDYKNAEYYYNLGLKISPNYADFYYELACIKSILNDITNALLYLEKFLYLNKNPIHKSDIENEPSFKNIIKNKKFKSLLKKYFK